MNRKRYYRIKNNLLEVVGSKGKIVYKIIEVIPEGIKIEDVASNGVEIVRVIPFNRIKR